MRVIAGKYKGRKLRAPSGTAVRPTSDRVRESVFSILGERATGRRVLDLFAGSGALGVEALSRGAVSATFVDSSPVAIAAIRSNLEAIASDAPVEVLRMKCQNFLQNAGKRAQYYDLVFLDPPYRLATQLGPDLAQPLWEVLAPDAIVICESDRRAPLDFQKPLHDERRYGDTLIRLYVNE